MGMGDGFPGKFISILRAGNAGLPRRGKSLVMASSHKSLKFDGAAANMRRLFGSRGWSRRQDVLVAEEAVGYSGSDEDLDACEANKKAKEHGGQSEKEGWRPRT